MKVLFNQRGGVLVLFAALILCMMGMAGLAIDIGYAYSVRTQMQNSVDAAAIAGGYELPHTSDAQTEAENYINLNKLDPAKATCTFPNGTREIDVTYTDTVGTFFMRALGINTMTISTAAAAERRNMITGGDLIFSGSRIIDIKLNGNGLYVDGSMHSNADIVINGSGGNVTGGVEAVGDVDTNAKFTDGATIEGAPYKNMPHLAAAEEAAWLADAKILTPPEGSTTVTLTRDDVVNQTLYVKGDLVVTGGQFTGSAAVIADGNITINGSGSDFSWNDSSLVIYSRGGDITFNGGALTLKGTLYAPNGDITIDGKGNKDGLTVYGGIIGQSINYNGNDLKVYALEPPETLPIWKVVLIK